MIWEWKKLLVASNSSAKYDLLMAKSLKKSGYMSILRVSSDKILGAFEDGRYYDELPSPNCFKFIGNWEYLSVDALIKKCEERYINDKGNKK